VAEAGATRRWHAERYGKLGRKAVSASQAVSGPMIGPAWSEDAAQLVPNWYDKTRPDATRRAKTSAKISIH
jgi:hypothetical protein